MSYKIIDINELPKESIWKGDARTFIQEGCVKAWGCQAPYGRISITAVFETPDGETVHVEKFVEKIITETSVAKDIRDAGY